MMPAAHLRPTPVPPPPVNHFGQFCAEHLGDYPNNQALPDRVARLMWSAFRTLPHHVGFSCPLTPIVEATRQRNQRRAVLIAQARALLAGSRIESVRS